MRKEVRFRITPLTWDQLEKLLSAADVTDSALLMLGLNCGFDNSDIGKLKLCDVDLENASVSHPRPNTDVNAASGIQWWKPGSCVGNHPVVLDPAVAEGL